MVKVPIQPPSLLFFKREAYEASFLSNPNLSFLSQTMQTSCTTLSQTLDPF